MGRCNRFITSVIDISKGWSIRSLFDMTSPIEDPVLFRPSRIEQYGNIHKCLCGSQFNSLEWIEHCRQLRDREVIENYQYVKALLEPLERELEDRHLEEVGWIL